MAELATLHFMVEPMGCPSCIRKIEGSLEGLEGVRAARVNFSTKRVAVERGPAGPTEEAVVDCLEAKGFQAVPFDPERLRGAGEAENKSLLRALAVAGFGLANVMLLSVSVWSGLAGDMGEGTRGLFHWISALIALPCIAVAGQPFLRSALTALGNRQLNMDVPIVLAVVLATALSLYRTATHEALVYFDAGLMLLFFLLIGRVLDGQARRKARDVAQNLIAFRARSARVVQPDGSHKTLAIEQIRPGMTVAVAPGDKLPVDGTIASGRSELDCSLVTGESLPQAAQPGDQVYAGTINLSGALTVTVSAVDQDTLLAEIVRLMEAAEQRRGRYLRLADRAAAIYAPTVHVLAAVTFAGWLLLSEMGWQVALMNAVAVLIITCPCALGLAVPAVQVVASGRLFKRGILVKSADGLERLAQVDTVVFDKTGTLTTGRFRLMNQGEIAPDELYQAAALAASSRHPLARALVRAAGPVVALGETREVPGKGLAAESDAGELRLGSRGWCGPEGADSDDRRSELWFSRPGAQPLRFAFEDQMRPDAKETVAALRAAGCEIALLSGDRSGPVGAAAEALDIADWRAAQSPADKIAALEDLRSQGKCVLMVGDGLNDAPALASAHASLSPTTASDISQTSADFLFQGESLSPVLEALVTARGARRLMLENFGLAFAYNCLAVPIAMAGLVTPLIAAVAMSASSILVTVNALRLHGARKETEAPAREKPEWTPSYT
ncbi:MAG: heavy metal translocating P-type ATPase [Pseudomonadota bacterium]